MAKCINFAYKIAQNPNFPGAMPRTLLGDLQGPPDPQLDFVPTNQVRQTGYFLAATALQTETSKLLCIKFLSLHYSNGS